MQRGEQAPMLRQGRQEVTGGTLVAPGLPSSCLDLLFSISPLPAPEAQGLSHPLLHILHFHLIQSQLRHDMVPTPEVVNKFLTPEGHHRDMASKLKRLKLEKKIQTVNGLNEHEGESRSLWFLLMMEPWSWNDREG